jgi:hypothetical protein
MPRRQERESRRPPLAWSDGGCHSVVNDFVRINKPIILDQNFLNQFWKNSLPYATGIIALASHPKRLHIRVELDFSIVGQDWSQATIFTELVERGETKYPHWPC